MTKGITVGTNDYIDAWAITDENGVNIKTVSDTRRAAIVNWLVVHERVLMTTMHDDQQIEAMWLELCGDAMAIPVRVFANLH